MKLVLNFYHFCLIVLFTVFVFYSCSLQVLQKKYIPYNLEGELVTSSHFGDFSSGFEYNACGIIAVNGKNPVIKQYNWDWDNDGVVDKVTYPPECKTKHIYSGEDVGIVTPSVTVLVEDKNVEKKSYSAQSLQGSGSGNNVFYTWNYGTWAINGGLVDDSSCSDLKAGETCSISFFAKYNDNGSIKNLPFAGMCIIPTSMNSGVLPSEVIKPTVAATVGEFKSVLNSKNNISDHIKKLILEDLHKKGIVADGDDSSLLKFTSSTACKGVQFVTNTQGRISFDFKAKSSFLETEESRLCLETISEIEDCKLQNTQTITFESYSSITTSSDYIPAQRLYTINPGSPNTWKVFESLNHDADYINSSPILGYNLLAFDAYGNPVFDKDGLNININDPVENKAEIYEPLMVNNSYSTEKISLFDFSINYSNARARVLQLTLSKFGSSLGSINVSITHGSGYSLECAPDCSEIRGVIKTNSSGIAKLKVLDAYGNILKGTKADKPVISWSIENAQGELPILSEKTSITDDDGYTSLNLSNLIHGKRRGSYKLVAKITGFSGSTSEKIFPIKTLPGSVSGISFSAYDDNDVNLQSGFDTLKKLDNLSEEAFVFKKINYETLSSYGKTVKVYIVDEENNMIDKSNLDISSASLIVVPESMVYVDGNINPACTFNSADNCKIKLEKDTYYSLNDPYGEFFYINSSLNYDKNVVNVKFIASMNIDGVDFSSASNPIHAKMGYGYEIKNPQYVFTDNTSYTNFIINANDEYYLNFDRDAKLKFEVCPADIEGGLDPRNSLLGISTIIELLGDKTNINEGDLSSVANVFDNSGFNVDNSIDTSSCAEAEISYEYTNPSAGIDTNLEFIVRDDKNTILQVLPFTIHSQSAAGINLVPASLTIDDVDYGVPAFFNENIFIIKTGEQKFTDSGINISLKGDNSNCFLICDSDGFNCTSSKNAEGQYKIKFIGGTCVVPANLDITATATLEVFAQSVSGESLSASLVLNALRKSAPQMQITFEGGFNDKIYKITDGEKPTDSDSTLNIKVENIGSSTGYNITTQLSTEFSNLFVLDTGNCNNATLAPGEFCYSTVKLNWPDSSYFSNQGPSITGTITVVENSNSFGFTAYYPSLDINRSYINFGTLAYGVNRNISIKITNNGNVPVSFDGFTGSSNDHLSLICSSGTIIGVNAAKNCTLSTIQYGTSSYSINVDLTRSNTTCDYGSINYNRISVRVLYTRSAATEAVLNMSTAVTNFGDIEINTSSTAKDINISKISGDLNATINSIVSSNPEFSISQGTCQNGSSIGSACTFYVTFAPISGGNNKSSSITLNYNDGIKNNIRQITLYGNGIMPDLSPVSLHAEMSNWALVYSEVDNYRGYYSLGDSNTIKQVRIINDGESEVTGFAMSVSGASDDTFFLTPPTLTTDGYYRSYLSIAPTTSAGCNTKTYTFTSYSKPGSTETTSLVFPVTVCRRAAAPTISVSGINTSTLTVNVSNITNGVTSLKWFIALTATPGAAPKDAGTITVNSNNKTFDIDVSDFPTPSMGMYRLRLRTDEAKDCLFQSVTEHCCSSIDSTTDATVNVVIHDGVIISF